MNRLKNPGRALILAIAILVPVLAAGAFTATLARPAQHLDEVVAAVVNNDDPVELEGQLVPLGRQLAAALVEGEGASGDPAKNYTWVMTNEHLAGEGLEEGEYAAVVTIPPEFSAAATSTADADAEPRRALIDVTVSPRARLADEAVTHNLVRAAALSLSNDLTGSYLENVFLGFNTLGEELGGAAEGARTLAEGAEELSGGAGELAGGTEQLAGGIGELAAGTGELAGGAGALAEGAGALAAGTGELAGGADELAGGLGELSGGMNGLADGTTALGAGARDLRSGTGELSAGAHQLASGAGELATGSREYAAGVSEFSDGLGELTGGAEEIAGGLGELNDAVSFAPEYLDQIEDGLQSGADDVRDFAGELAGATGSVEAIITEVCAADPDGRACTALREFIGDSEQLDEFLAGAAATLNDLADQMENAAGDEGGLGQIQQLITGIEQLADGANELAAGLDQAHGAADELAAGADGLADGNAELAAGMRDLAGGADQLHGGVGELQSGVDELGEGSRALARAGEQAAGGAEELAGGAAALTSGSRDLAAGSAELAGGAEELAYGTGALAGGAEEIAEGTGELAAGTEQLSGGTSELAEGLGQATDEIPTYPDGKRETLAEVIADPMTLAGDSGMSFRWLAFFSVVALWAGGLWLLAAYPAVAANARTSTRSASALTWRSIRIPLAIAAVQGIAVGILVGIFADLAPGAALGFGLLAVLISAVFTVVQRGIVAHLGWIGVALTVLIALLALATALVSAMPSLATEVVSWLPVGPAISASQAVEFSLPGLAAPILGLLAWGIAGLIAVMLATRREQTRIS